MIYARIENGKVTQYPLSEQGIRSLFVNTSFSNPFVAPDGFAVVVSSPQPKVDYTQNITEKTPVLINGNWTQQWEVSTASPEQISARTEQKAVEVRQERNGLLAECDWTQLADSPVDHEDWAVYRQDLRDITTQPGFPWDVQWPETP
jgi:hypothetical protein